MCDLLVYFLVVLVFQPCFSINFITQNQPFKDGDVLISEGETFELVFFSPGNSSNRYVGVRYNNIPERNVVWVANRDNPLINTSGVLSIDKTGQLVLSYSETPSIVIWSSKLSSSVYENYSAMLLDSGNLVLFKDDYSEQNVVWQGFDHPTDTYLPGMKLKLNKRTGENTFITSWKSPDNPGTGEYTYKLILNGSVPQIFLYQGLTPKMRIGPNNGRTFSGIPEYTVSAADEVSTIIYIDNEEEVLTSYTIHDTTIITRLVVNDTIAVVERLTWDPKLQIWYTSWAGPRAQCDSYGQCGAFSNCNPAKVGERGCECLPGYEERSAGGSLRNPEGCIRKPGARLCQNGEGFKKIHGVKVPDTTTARLESGLQLKACNDLCLKDCSCTGYMIANISNNRGCLSWYGDLVDIRQFSKDGQDLYLRVDASELGDNIMKRFIKVFLPIVALFLILVLVYLCVLKKKNKATETGSRDDQLFNSSEDSDINPNIIAINGRETNSADVHCFLLSTIVAATDNFSLSNKIGVGGFGTVYKGQLRGGQDIAVKRLSVRSSQGIEEFRNEIILIGKLQHRNLVRLLGYCIQREKMLVYEYLPNKGLDCFIFGRQSVLDWRTRFNIAMGIARGMIYLHHDSRLRIIHRDLKASNVLLDAFMNPKISDFGMARIFGNDQNEDKTKRVVGTYGYMSPEYAMEGLFSIKSDVFSFGVLLLEIISGRKNTSIFSAENTVNLIGHVWDRWLEGEALDIVDPSLGESYEVTEVLRCINIGLLCVQESAAARPTMSEVASMLCNERIPPSSPEQPAYVNRKSDYFGAVISNSSADVGATTVCEMTVSIVDGR